MNDLTHSRNKNDCGVRALAAACGASYEDAWDALELAGRKPGRYTYNKQLIAAALALGKVLQFNDSMAGVTVRRLSRELPAGSWIVHVNRHLLAVVDGIVVDWAIGTLKRVKYAFKVV